jgi:hypothetical protein
MLAHVRSVHDKFSKKFYCPIENCGQYFNYKHVLDRHMKNNTHKEVIILTALYINWSIQLLYMIIIILL